MDYKKLGEDIADTLGIELVENWEDDEYVNFRFKTDVDQWDSCSFLKLPEQSYKHLKKHFEYAIASHMVRRILQFKDGV